MLEENKTVELKDKELKQVSGGIKEHDEQLVNSNIAGAGGVIDIEYSDNCHFNPSRWEKKSGVTIFSYECASCKYNEHPGWLKSTCNADVEQ